jgi:hypothetical protein
MKINLLKKLKNKNYYSSYYKYNIIKAKKKE